MTENEYKEIRLSLDYHESRAGKVHKKIGYQLSKTEQFQTELTELDNHISILDCALDRHALLREVANWQNRKNRTVERILKTLKDQNSLLQLRESLNERWAELTGDGQPLCDDLCLKIDGKIYFL